MWRAVAGEHATHVKIMTSFVEHAIQQQGKIARELQGRSFVWKRFGVEFYRSEERRVGKECPV